jgi:hypothetical protein
MKITIKQLRKIISEEVERCVLRSAGLTGGGVSRLMRHKELPPPGLGDEEGKEQTKDYEEEKEWSQWTVDVRRKNG